MADFSDDERALLEKRRRNLGDAIERVEGIVREYTLPNHYTELTDIMRRQQSAITSMLETGEPGCDLASLEPDMQKLVYNPHLTNLSYVSTESVKMDEKDREAFYQPRQVALHDLKNLATHATLGHMAVKKVMGHRGISENGRDDNGPTPGASL